MNPIIAAASVVAAGLAVGLAASDKCVCTTKFRAIS